MRTFFVALIAALCLTATSNAQTFSTSFNTADNFITGGTAPVTLPGGLVTFSGGQQQQGFLGAAYNSGPAAYLFINGGGASTERHRQVTLG